MDYLGCKYNSKLNESFKVSLFVQIYIHIKNLNNISNIS